MYDEEIEKAVLFYIIFDNAQYQISEDDFVNAMNKRIAIAINELRRLKENVSMISVQSRCKENQNEVLAYISKIGDTVIRGLNNPDELYSKLIKLSQKRKLFMLAKKMQAEILEQEEADIYGQKIIDEINKITSREEKEKTFVQKIADATLEIENSWKNSSDYSLYTGIYDLDSMICGLHKQELTIIGARPGVGKTTLALQIAEKISRNNKNVLFVSLEMSDTQLIQKMIARIGNVKSYRMRMGTIEDEDWNRISNAIGKLSDLKFNTNSKIRTIQKLELEARKLKNRGNLDLLIIDYIQLLKSKDKFNSREQEVADISRRLKLLSLELDIPVIALCQLNRNASNNEPNLSDLRESGSLEQDADNVIFLHQENPESNIVTLKIAKQRAGEIGKVAVAFKKDISTFVNLERTR